MHQGTVDLLANDTDVDGDDLSVIAASVPAEQGTLVDNGDGTDTILDFEIGIDRIGLVQDELVFTDLTITQDGSDTLLGVASTGETLAVLNNVQASALGEASFAIVPDVSNPDEAIALI